MSYCKSLIAATCIFWAGNLAAYPLSNGSEASAVIGQPDFNSSSINSVSGKSLYTPSDLTAASGRIYVCDTENNRILWWNEADFFLGKEAAGTLGQTDSVRNEANRNGTPTAATLNKPRAVTVDTNGNVWVADTQNHRILKFSMPTTSGQAAELVLGQADFYSNLPNRGNLPGAETLQTPLSLRTDAAGNLWVSDSGNRRVLRYNTPSVNGSSASVVLGNNSFTDTASHSPSDIFTGKTDGLAFDSSGALWVADYGNHRVLRFDPPFSSGQRASLVLGQTSFTTRTSGAGARKFNYPYRLVFDGYGFLWISDTQNNRLLKFIPPFSNGQSALTNAGQDDFESTGPDRSTSRTSPGGISSPLGVAFISTKLLVADSRNNRILRWSEPYAAADMVIGQQDFYSAGENRVTEDRMYFPSDVALSTVTGRVFAVDRKNNRILWWNNHEAVIAGQAADGVLGQADLTHSATNRGGSGASASGLSDPMSVCLDGDGNLWTADYGNHRVLRYRAPLSSGQSADIVLGQSDFTSSDPNRGQTVDASTLYNPTHVAADTSGSIWVADRNNNRVLKFMPPFSSGQNAALVLGQSGMNGSSANNGGISAASLNLPFAAVPDNSGNLWVSDTRNNRILMYPSPAANGQQATLQIGQPDFLSSATATVSRTSFYNPVDIAINDSGELWISDMGNNRLLRFSAPAAPGATAGLVLGQNDFVSNNAGTPSSATGFTQPYGIATDGFGTLWVADSTNNRLLRFNGRTRTPLSPQATELSTTSATVSWKASGAVSYNAVLGEGTDYRIKIASAPQSGNSITYQNLQMGGTYYFTVKISSEPDAAYDRNGLTLVLPQSPAPPIVPPTATQNTSGIQLYPNPFSPGSQKITIEGLLPGAGVSIYTISGELVRYIDGTGGGKTIWDGRNETGKTVAAGIYIAILKTAQGTRKRKIAVLK